MRRYVLSGRYVVFTCGGEDYMEAKIGFVDVPPACTETDITQHVRMHVPLHHLVKMFLRPDSRDI